MLARPRERILVIDDNTLNRKLFAALLESRGHDVVQAATGNTGLDLVRKHPPDLIILDVQLPDISGLEVAVALKTDDRTCDIPIIAITAFMADLERDARTSGCDGFMTKPVTTSEFLITVESFLQRARSH